MVLSNGDKQGRRVAKVRMVLLSAVAALVTGPLALAPEGALACSDASHCYGIADWPVSSPSGFNGADVQLRSNCMSLDDSSSHFIDNETLLATTGW